MGDAWSLQFCGGWEKPHDTIGYRAFMRGPALRISPDPFAGAAVPVRVAGRRIAARRYRDDAELRAAVADATPELVTGEARGVE